MALQEPGLTPVDQTLTQIRQRVPIMTMEDVEVAAVAAVVEDVFMKCLCKQLWSTVKERLCIHVCISMSDCTSFSVGSPLSM